MKLSKLIAKYGDENVNFQLLDNCFIEAKSTKHHNRITFGTNAQFDHKGMKQQCFIVWMDRDKIDEIIKNNKVDEVVAEQMSKALEILKRFSKRQESALGFNGEYVVTLGEINDAISELEAPKTCFECEHHSVIDGYCKSPNTLTKNLCEYLGNVGCNHFKSEEG